MTAASGRQDPGTGDRAGTISDKYKTVTRRYFAKAAMKTATLRRRTSPSIENKRESKTRADCFPSCHHIPRVFDIASPSANSAATLESEEAPGASVGGASSSSWKRLADSKQSPNVRPNYVAVQKSSTNRFGLRSIAKHSREYRGWQGKALPNTVIV